jgi:hypothetical protein
MTGTRTRKVAAAGLLLLAALGLGGCYDGLHSYDFSYSQSYGYYGDHYGHYDHCDYGYYDHHHGHHGHGHHRYDHCH